MGPKTHPASRIGASMTPERWRQVDAVVRGALALPPDARAAFITDACQRDVDLRREVEELLAVPTGDFLMRPAAAAFAEESDVAIRARVSAALADRYLVERELGRGATATVYLAQDVRHHRHVAVKVLHSELAAALGTERFLKEIELTANLQHPHVLPLFDSGSERGLLFYVMPYVDGETLRARLARERQLPIVDAVRIATEVASALEYAHRRGVIHRDVKPENILLAQDGQALVADFGIALAISHAAGARLTQSGLSLGTPQYMAPEQAAAERSIDARVDVYALGAVTYEMLAGEPPFTGPSAQAIIARGMTESPRGLGAERPSVPPHVEAAVRTALAKLPADRFASASAFAAALATASPQLDRRPPGASHVPRISATVAAVATALIAAAAALGLGVGRWGAAREQSAQAAVAGRPVRFVIQLDSAVLESDPAMSPDGRTVVYAATSRDGTRLYTRRLDQLAPQPIPGTEDGTRPFFSPDGKWLAFFSHGALRKTRVDGGTALVVTAAPAAAVVAKPSLCGWGKDDMIVCAAWGAASATLFRVAAGGGTPSSVHVADTTLLLLEPRPLPDGKAVLVTVDRGPSVPVIGVLELATGRVRQFGQGQGARYVDGSIVYASANGELLRQPFDLTRLETTGSPEKVMSDLETFDVGGPGFDVSETGAVVYSPPASGPWSLKLTLNDRAGRIERVIAARRPWTPRFSFDGHRLAYGAVAPGQFGSDVWITDLQAGTTQRLTAADRDGNDPQWRPDGRAIVYSVDAARGTGKHLVVQELEGAVERPLISREGTQWPSDWTPDGREVLFTYIRDGRGPLGEPVSVQEIWAQPLDGSPPRPYLTSRAHERGARVSADGHWVAYVSDETGRNEVYVQSYPTPGHKVLVSDGGGDNPVWRRDGRELYYWQADQLVAVALGAGGPGEPLELRGRTPLFRATYVPSGHANYDVSPDGKQFVLVTGNTRANRFVVALNVLNVHTGQSSSPHRD